MNKVVFTRPYSCYLLIIKAFNKSELLAWNSLKWHRKKPTGKTDNNTLVKLKYTHTTQDIFSGERQW